MGAPALLAGAHLLWSVMYRTITAEHFGSLALPVGEFLALEHGTEYAGYSILSESGVNESEAHKFATNREGRSVKPGSDVGQVLVVCSPESTLQEVSPVGVQCHCCLLAFGCALGSVRFCTSLLYSRCTAVIDAQL